MLTRNSTIYSNKILLRLLYDKIGSVKIVPQKISPWKIAPQKIVTYENCPLWKHPPVKVPPIKFSTSENLPLENCPQENFFRFVKKVSKPRISCKIVCVSKRTLVILTRMLCCTALFKAKNFVFLFLLSFVWFVSLKNTGPFWGIFIIVERFL